MKSKKIIIPAAAVLIIACIGAVGVKTFLGPCVHEDGSFGPCHWAGQAVFGIWLLLLAESLLLTAGSLLSAGASPQGNSGFGTGLFSAMLCTAVLGICMPGGLIRLCSMATMRCLALMRPAMIILFVLAALFCAAGIIMSRRK